jgi:hypothetical protein
MTPRLRRKRMRTRHQNGWVEERGSRQKRWYGHYYVYEANESGKEPRRYIGVQLGEKAKLRKWEAESKLRKIIASVTKEQPKPNALTLEWFTRERFLPMRASHGRRQRGKQISTTLTGIYSPA